MRCCLKNSFFFVFVWARSSLSSLSVICFIISSSYYCFFCSSIHTLGGIALVTVIEVSNLQTFLHKAIFSFAELNFLFAIANLYLADRHFSLSVWLRFALSRKNRDALLPFAFLTRVTFSTLFYLYIRGFALNVPGFTPVNLRFSQCMHFILAITMSYHLFLPSLSFFIKPFRIKADFIFAIDKKQRIIYNRI